MESDANVEATTAPEIRVFAMFPLDPQPADLAADWTWVHFLTFPVETLRKLQFSRRLYKWIRYATGVVVGAQGDLSFGWTSPPNVIDYDAALPSDPANLYYHISDAERQGMFPADPDVNRTNVTSSVATTRRVEFRSDVVRRDGSCILSGFPAQICDAVHLLPHSKGDEYIKTYTRHRSRDLGENDIVDKIDDTRNGIVLNKTAHCTLGVFIAFLMTPNFAMSTADIDSTMSPTERRCTAHLFVPGQMEYFGWPVPSGSAARIPAQDRPPDILFDAVYANAVLRHFAAQSLLDTLKQWKSTFYPREITNEAQVSHHEILDGRAAQEEKRNEQNNARDKCLANKNHAHGDCDHFDLLMLPYIMIPRDRLEASWREAEEKKVKRERSHLEDKVMGWAKQVANACS